MPRLARHFPLISSPSSVPSRTPLTVRRTVALRVARCGLHDAGNPRARDKSGEGERAGDRPLRETADDGERGGVTFWPNLPANVSVTFSPKAELKGKTNNILSNQFANI